MFDEISYEQAPLPIKGQKVIVNSETMTDSYQTGTNGTYGSNHGDKSRGHVSRGNAH